jgi:hypothetical protein
MDDKKSKYASLVQQNVFGPTLLHKMMKLAKGTNKA